MELMKALGLKDRQHFAKTYLQPGLDAGLVEMTKPDRPRSRTQRYRLTTYGRYAQDFIPATNDE
ncbi:MAG: cell filamentation protein Fic [Caldilineaceae bacterium SB0662_bin_9]|uniref:Cell filamentation protein Fic n=1 Tax=Caldilineaceae bacterium SB0662_bin_9 TaxID=2605258 RepID=A0A6B1DTW9_9CHLR|nr:cell filamentation protein Fic [Caldilineaceae bacterium SB0662_bin_9]